jgi:hypothetical protein
MLFKALTMLRTPIIAIGAYTGATTYIDHKFKLMMQRSLLQKTPKRKRAWPAGQPLQRLVFIFGCSGEDSLILYGFVFVVPNFFIPI